MSYELALGLSFVGPIMLAGSLSLRDIVVAQQQSVWLDWTTEIGNARARIGHKVALQGNMDPSMLYASPVAIRAEVANILSSFGKGTGHVFNLGHGITPEVDPAHVSVFVEAVHELSSQYHS